MANTITIQAPFPNQAEYPAGAAITPGMLLERNGSGQVIAHNSVGAAGLRAFALENAEVGGEISDNYASGENVKVLFARSGDVVYALVADTVNVTVGDLLESAGDGTLAINAATTQLVAVAEESFNNTTGGNSWLKVRIA